MDGTLQGWSRQRKRKFRRRAQKVKDADWRRRYDIVLHAVNGRSQRQIAAMLHCAVSTVTRTLERFAAGGEAALVDRREENGQRKVTETYMSVLMVIVAHTPCDCGYRRTTWTLELLVDCMKDITGITISLATMSRLLRRLRIRRGWPRPTVGCPWPKAKRDRRIRLIRRLLKTLAPDEAAVWEDEVDIHLNPKIGPDYMLRGQQKEVLTPGQNVKRYVAGAMAVGSGQLTKLINQLLFNISCAGVAEVLPMAAKLGLDPEKVTEVVTTGTGRSFAAEFFLPLALENRFDQGYPLKHAYKDMISAAEISAHQKIPLPVVQATTATFQMALNQGLGDESKGALIKIFERLLDIEFRKKKGASS